MCTSPEQAIDKAICNIFGEVLGVTDVKAFCFFTYCLAQRSTSRSFLARAKAAGRMGKKSGKPVPKWVLDDMRALHLYACHLGGVAVHEMVTLAREAGSDEFYKEVSEAVGALLTREMIVFAGFSSAVRALASWSVGGMCI